MHGGGNDFVFMNNMDGSLALFGPSNAISVCDRRRGIGADGVVLLEPATSKLSACSWRFYNRDGSIAEMCGNGARCFAAFARRCGIVTGAEPFTFDTVAGTVSAQFIDGGQVAVGLTEPRGYRVFPHGLGGVCALGALHYIDTGVPHVVALVPDVSVIDVMSVGSTIRRYANVPSLVFSSHDSARARCSELQPQGANVNFVQVRVLLPALRAPAPTCAPQVMPADTSLHPARPWLRVRTFERGVEAETQVCPVQSDV